MIDRFQLGLVSNCFLRQLANGSPLVDLIAKSNTYGLTHFELRQTALGKCEDDRLFPIPDKLSELASSCSQSTFNLAIAFPFWDLSRGINDPLFERAKEAARALSPNKPHLRLVDLDSHFATITESTGRVEHVCSLAQAMGEIGGFLSIENSPYQTWPALFQLLRACQEDLGDNHDLLRLCFDPCNLFPKEAEHGRTAIRQLKRQDISMLHFKQRVGDAVDVRLRSGELDWADQLRGVAEIDYRGLGLFEITADEALWDNLAASLAYLNEL